MELKIMSFNLRYWNEEDGENSWPYRRDGVVQLIEETNPAIIGTQEGLPNMLAELDKALPSYQRSGESREPSGDGEYCAIYYRSDLFQVKNHGQIWLSEKPDLPGSKSWDSSLPRICTWVELKHRTSGAELVFFNTHLDHMGQVARLKGAELILKYMADYSRLPRLLTGDFNCTPDSAPIQLLEEQLVNLLKVAGAGHVGTFHSFTGKTTTGPIDYIFASSDIEVVSAAVLDQKVGGSYPSDHFPVMAQVRI